MSQDYYMHYIHKTEQVAERRHKTWILNFLLNINVSVDAFDLHTVSTSQTADPVSIQYRVFPIRPHEAKSVYALPPG